MKTYELIEKPGFESLAIVERPVPVPGPHRVVVRMRAASLNYRDLVVAKGRYGGKSSAGLTPLSDGAGEVTAIGDGVTRVKTGDRVAGIFMQTYLSGGLTAEKSASALGGAISGVLAEYVAFDEEGLVQIPEHLSYEEAATLPCAAVTAWNALVVEGGVKPGDTILLEGTGGVSIFSLQFAKVTGARVIITSSSDEKLERARRLGADETINYKTNPKWEQAAWDLSGKRGVDIVIETGGSGTLNKSLRAVRPGGRISLMGTLSGTGGDITTAYILQKHIRLQGIYVGSRDLFEDMNRAVAQHQIRPVIDRVFGFEQARDAYAYLESGAHFGKVVISI